MFLRSCYYKSYVQTARKRGLPLPTELEKSRALVTAKKPRLEDIEANNSVVEDAAAEAKASDADNTKDKLALDEPPKVLLRSNGVVADHKAPAESVKETSDTVQSDEGKGVEATNKVDNQEKVATRMSTRRFAKV
jgi:hypothetical protein